MSNLQINKSLTHYALTGALLLLTACGGGGGGDSSSDINQSDNSQNESVVTSTNESTATTVNVETDGGSISLDGGVAQTEITIDTTKNISLSWLPPAINTVGEPMDPADISGYEISYFSDNSSESDGEIIYVDLGTTTEVTIDNLPPGTYQFSISAIENN